MKYYLIYYSKGLQNQKATKPGVPKNNSIKILQSELDPSQLVAAFQVQAGAERGHGQVVVVDGELRGGQAGQEEAEDGTQGQVQHHGLGVRQQPEEQTRHKSWCLFLIICETCKYT